MLCAFQVKHLEVNWNGNVPLCSFSAQQIGVPGLILGNVMKDKICDLWGGEVMHQYREGHYKRQKANAYLQRLPRRVTMFALIGWTQSLARLG